MLKVKFSLIIHKTAKVWNKHLAVGVVTKLGTAVGALCDIPKSRFPEARIHFMKSGAFEGVRQRRTHFC